LRQPWRELFPSSSQEPGHGLNGLPSRRELGFARHRNSKAPEPLGLKENCAAIIRPGQLRYGSKRA
jgi:hypothetical protein